MSEETAVAVQRKDKQMVPAFDLSGSQDLPNLHEEGIILPIELQAAYLKLEEGEEVRAFVSGIEIRELPSFDNPSESVPVKVVEFIIQNREGIQANVYNAQKRLVSAIENAINDKKIAFGSPVVLTYLGKKKNEKNDKLSGRWMVNPIIINTAK